MQKKAKTPTIKEVTDQLEAQKVYSATLEQTVANQAVHIAKLEANLKILQAQKPMANELRIPLDPVAQTGLTVQAKVRQADGTQEGATVAMTEVTPAYYVGDFSLVAVSDGDYSVEFLDSTSGRLVGTGTLSVVGNAEFTLRGIADAVWASTTRTLTSFGSLVADIWGYVTRTVTGGTIDTNVDMRGTDGANTVVPDNATIANIHTDTQRVDALIEDSAGDRFTAKALETAPTAEMSEAELHAYLDSYTNKGDWKADVSALATQLSIDNLNDLSTADIDARLTAYGIPTLTEMTAAFTEIKGSGWTTADTLKAIKDSIASGGVSAEDVWTYATRELTAGTKDAEIDALPAQIADVREQVWTDWTTRATP